mmetsp:Transcript_4430/g.12734  ORF Transcript_4430/g.12734 Transcript_4430/m.12734 type:complete len:210 (+) Transcript_4430:298-927(+)
MSIDAEKGHADHRSSPDGKENANDNDNDSDNDSNSNNDSKSNNDSNSDNDNDDSNQFGKYRIKNASIFNFVYPNNVTTKYKILGVIGKGSFGVVRRCQNIETGEEFALKAILKENVPDVEQLRTEINILLEVDHPHIIKLYEVYEDVATVYLITELCTGGELYDRVVEKTHSPEGHFSEFCVARIIRNILSGIRYCHEEKNIVHRDLVR